MKTKRRHLSKSGALETEFVEGEVLEAYDALAREALGSCRTQITMAARFLNAALWRLPLERAPLTRTISVGARVLQYDPERVVDLYRESPDELVRDCLHAVLHCVFHHPFDRRFAEADTWSLACDIAVELCALDLCGARFSSGRDAERLEAARRLAQVARNLTAPALYQVLRHGGAGEQLYLAHGLTGDDIAAFRDLFARDAHDLWAVGPNQPEGASSGSAAVPDMQAGEGQGADGADAAGASASEAGAQEDGRGGGDAATASEPDSAAEPSDDVADGAADDLADGAADDLAEGTADDVDVAIAAADDAADDPEALEAWKKVSKQVEAELRMQRRRASSGDGTMLLNLSVANKKPANYDDFLKRFATLAEDIRVNDDEFDYVFYTYGLNRYGNMPLVEPLEYVEARRVREFVIALDTSGSCSGRLIREFVARTYDILRQRTSFGDDVNVHIVQCDKEVRSATKVTSLRQLEEYADSFWVSGGGGTDFKPVFSYVDSLVEQGEFADLRGLVYFTDGYGSFPVRAPDYEVAFVFVDAEGIDVRVPPWAMKVVMSQGEIVQE